MEGYTHLSQLADNMNTSTSNNNNSRVGFVYGGGGAPALAPSSSSLQFPGRTFAGSGGADSLRHLAFGGLGVCFDQSQHHAVKTEAGSSYTNSNHKFHHYGASSVIAAAANQRQASEVLEVDAVKAKIIAHPQYSNLLEAYMDCHKVGAPPEVVARLAQVRQDFESWQRGANLDNDDDSKDPELDQFMEAYYDMLVKYREELTRPLHEAMEFMGRVETQLSMLTTAPPRVFNSDDNSGGGGGSSDDDQENSGDVEAGGIPAIDPRAEDRELKNHLLKKYSGYLSSLKQELSKKKKKGKLPKEARQKLLSWWELHYKWPYPSESEKVALAEATGLDQKQINNWFINQRKRHWKPSEDMQFMVMDGLQHHPQNPTLFMEGHYLGEGSYRLAP